MFLLRAFFLVAVAFVFTACATGNCRQTTQLESPPRAVAASAPADQKMAGVASGSPAATTALANSKASPTPAPDKTKSAKRDGKVVVYKYDGSLQCNMGKAIPVEAMASELTSAGIKVLASEKKPDGLMHIQVCGQPTGMVNAYTIQQAQLPAAEKIGFKKWEFEQ